MSTAAGALTFREDPVRGRLPLYRNPCPKFISPPEDFFLPERKLRLSLLSYSMLTDAALGRITPDVLCGICRENGIGSIDLMTLELRLYGAKKLKQAMDESGIACGCLIANIDFLAFPHRAEKWLQNALALCAEMDAKTLMVVPGQPVGRRLTRLRTLSRSAMTDEAVRFFTTAVAEGTKLGITVGLEDTPQKDKPFSSPAELTNLLTRVPGLGLIFDTGNFLIADPGTDLMASYEALRPYIIRIHLKDVIRQKAFGTERCVDGLNIVPVITGHGILPMRDFLRKLKDDGYNGDLCVEYAAAKGVHGSGHGKALSAYTDYIRGVWEGRNILSQ